MNRVILTTMTAAAIVVLSTGCSNKTTDDAPETSTAQAASVIPASYFSTQAPTDAVPLIDAKATANEGDEVVVTARIGGRVESFLANRAMFYITDASIPSCADMGDEDHCKTPWDYCCEHRDNLLRHMATVQIVDEQGRPLKESLEHAYGLEPLKTVVVKGTVSQTDEDGAFVITAKSIHVKEG